MYLFLIWSYDDHLTPCHLSAGIQPGGIIHFNHGLQFCTHQHHANYISAPQFFLEFSRCKGSSVQLVSNCRKNAWQSRKFWNYNSAKKVFLVHIGLNVWGNKWSARKQIYSGRACQCALLGWGGVCASSGPMCHWTASPTEELSPPEICLHYRPYNNCL